MDAGNVKVVENQPKISSSSLPHPVIEPHVFSAYDQQYKASRVDNPFPEKKQAVLQLATHSLPEVYRRVNPAFKYSPSSNPRRILTEPSERVGNNGNDNSASNLVLCVNDILHSETGSFRSFRVLELLGEGTFGQVVKVEDCETKKFRAVKVIKNKPAYHNQAMMEIKILKLLNEKYDPDDSHHILRLLDHFSFKNHLCLVFEMLSVNLYELIRQNQFRGLSCNLIRTFIKQLLASLRVLRDSRVIHCDLKPENVLLVKLSSAEIKLIDFGSACLEFQTVYSYIQSRFYRSPEVLLGLPYDSSIDMWSLGCIAAELFLGLPIFPGVSQHNQLSRIISLRNMPPHSMLDKGKSTGKFFVKHEGEPPAGEAASVEDGDASNKEQKHYFTFKSAAEWAKENNIEPEVSKRYFKGNTLEEVVRVYPMRKNMTQAERDKETALRTTFLHFLEGLLRWDPHKRWSPWVASQHPFITRQDLSTWNENAVLQEEARLRANMQVQTHNLSAHQAAAKAGPFSLLRASPAVLNAVATLDNPVSVSNGNPANLIITTTGSNTTTVTLSSEVASTVSLPNHPQPEPHPQQLAAAAAAAAAVTTNPLASDAPKTDSADKQQQPPPTSDSPSTPSQESQSKRKSQRGSLSKRKSNPHTNASPNTVPLPQQERGRARANTMNGGNTFIPSTPPSSNDVPVAGSQTTAAKNKGVKIEKRYHPEKAAIQSHTWAHPNRSSVSKGSDSQSPNTTPSKQRGVPKANGHLHPPEEKKRSASAHRHLRTAHADLEPASGEPVGDDTPPTPQLSASSSMDENTSPSPFLHHHRESSGSSGSHRSSISSIRSNSSGSTSAGVEGQVPADTVEGDLDTPSHRRSVSDSASSMVDGHGVRRRVRSEDGVGGASITIKVENEAEGDSAFSTSEANAEATWDPYFQSSSESSPKSVNSMSTSRVEASDYSSSPSSPMSPESSTLSEEQSQQQLQQKLRAHPRPVVKQQTGQPTRQDWAATSASSLKPETQQTEDWAYQNTSRSVPQASQLYGGSQSWTDGADLQNSSFFLQSGKRR